MRVLIGWHLRKLEKALVLFRIEHQMRRMKWQKIQGKVI